eukprot:CAMPEP_0174718870 /NCGR_PEP_ID=MMETSP1094-20130205/30207_1 /TAXON_ID=156173 /ORGANISM="Chrysochromulina brevifilum, Strain UTEX LB 985" /LENGTH=322 /DNA_ID=CAMNT_0015919075 /DNA_START=122 /DNA_END=1091 /DNA_ORIENTATION=+
MTTVRQWANFIPRVRASSPSRTQEDCPSCHDMVAKKSDEAVEWPIQPCAPFPPLGTTMHIVTVEGRKREHSHASSFPIVGHLSDQLLDHEFGEDDPRLLNCCSISGTNSPSTSSSGALLHGDGGTDALPEHWTIANALAEPTPTPIEDDAPLPPRLAADGLGEHDAAVHLSQPAFSSLPGSVQGDKVGGIGGSSCCSRERFDAASSNAQKAAPAAAAWAAGGTVEHSKFAAGNLRLACRLLALTVAKYRVGAAYQSAALSPIGKQITRLATVLWRMNVEWNGCKTACAECEARSPLGYHRLCTGDWGAKCHIGVAHVHCMKT